MGRARLGREIQKVKENPERGCAGEAGGDGGAFCQGKRCSLQGAAGGELAGSARS